MTLDSVDWVKLSPISPNFFFSPKDFDLSDEYNQGWKVTDIFPVNSTGVTTHRDHFAIDFNLEVLRKRIEDFRDLKISDEDIMNLYDLKDTRDWQLSSKRCLSFNNKNWADYFSPYLYRPFDTRFTYHHSDVVELTKGEVMNHLKKSNIALIVCRQQKTMGFQHCFVTQIIGDGNSISIHSRERSYFFPLYTYPNTENEQTNLFQEKTANFSPKFLTAIKEKLGYIPTPEAIFYYIYAIFHSPTYRQRYAEFLKIDFPRVPLTNNDHLFKQLGKIGQTLVNLHLMKSPLLDTLITDYHEGDQSDRTITQITYHENSQKVTINKSAYFVGITETVWNFKIGGYQVLDKWLKDRKKANYCLTDEDILHYQTIVVALSKTIELMAEIDKIIPFFPIE
jgi:predicted helicase